MKKFVKYIIFLVVFGGAITLAVYAGNKGQEVNQQTICNDIIIDFADNDKVHLISSKEIANLLAANKLNPIGKPYYKIQAKAIEDVIEKQPTIKNTECFKTPNGAIKLVVKQRKPVFRVIGTKNYYVDEERKTMPISLNFSIYVPIVTGNVPETMATGKLFDFCQYINNDPFWSDQIVQINVDNRKKVELIPLVGEHVIEMGNLDRYEAKLEKLRKMYLYGLNEIGWNVYSIINIEYKDQVVCTRK